MSKISTDNKQNEEILIEAFVTFFNQKVIPENGHLIFNELLKTSLYLFSQKNNLSLHNIAIIIRDINVTGHRAKEQGYVQAGISILPVE